MLVSIKTVHHTIEDTKFQDLIYKSSQIKEAHIYNYIDHRQLMLSVHDINKL